MLECSRGISESKRYNTPFKGAIIGMEGSFPLVTFLNPDKVVSVPEINFGEELSPTSMESMRDG